LVAVPGSYTTFNDRPTTSHEDVLALIDKALALPDPT